MRHYVVRGVHTDNLDIELPILHFVLFYANDLFFLRAPCGQYGPVAAFEV